MAETLTRRKMLGATFAAGAAAGIAALSGCKQEETPVTPEPATPATPEPVKFKVYDPSGAMQITQMFAPRLDTLEGKTIAFVADDSWEDARMFPIIKQHHHRHSLHQPHAEAGKDIGDGVSVPA